MSSISGALDATLTLLLKQIKGRNTYAYTTDFLPKLKGNYVEIGVQDGIGAYAMAYQYPLKHAYAISKPGQTSDEEKELLNTHLKEIINIDWIENTSQGFMSELDDERVAHINASWITINGSDSTEDAEADLQLAMRLIGNRQCIIALNNMNKPAVQKSFNDFVNQYDARLIYIAKITSDDTMLMDLKSVE